MLIALARSNLKAGEKTLAMMIKEYVDGGFYSHVGEYAQTDLELTEADSAAAIDPDSLMVDIEGIHAAPFATRNYTRYMPKCLKNSVPSWTSPYRRPLIKHHNEKDGEIIGRICEAKYKKDGTLSGTPALVFTVNVPGQAKEDVKNGLLETTSIGAIAHDVRCSICGQQLSEGNMCEHERGVKYNGETCYWDIYDMEAKELSYVIVPSDMFSKNLAHYPATKSRKTLQTKESFGDDVVISKKEGDQKMAEKKDAALETAEAKVAELESQVASLNEEKAALEATVAEMTEAKAALEADNEQLKAQLEESSEMKETLEKELTDAKSEIKESLINNMQTLREALGKSPIDDEKVSARSVDSIRDSILDMKEELQNVAAKAAEVKKEPELPTPGSLQNPTLAEAEKESAETANKKKLNLKEELFSALCGVASAQKRK